MALTKAQNATIRHHRAEYGTKHANTMRREMEKGKNAKAAHKIASRK